MRWPKGLKVTCISSQTGFLVQVGQTYTVEGEPPELVGVQLAEFMGRDPGHSFKKHRFVIAPLTELEAAIYGVPYEAK